MNSFTLDYQGSINDSITYQLASLMDEALVEESVEPRARGSMKVLLVEQLQNIQRYSCENHRGTVKIGREDEALFIETVNKVPAGICDELKKRLRDLVGLDQATIQKRFRETLKSPPLSPGLGAGLGLLLLAKKSAKSLAYRFVEHQGEDPQFSLKSFVFARKSDG